MVLQKLKWN